jgi:CheY-like chemotaxis protein
MPRILVVEDDEDWQELLKDFLEEDDYEVIIASDRDEAVRELAKAKSQKKSFDLATVDMQLSSKIGKATGRAVVDHLKRYRIPCIVVSGSIEKIKEVVNLLKKYGVHNVIGKDEFEPEEFRKMVREVLSAKTQREKATLPEQQLPQVEDIGGDELAAISLSKLKELLQIHRKNLEELETRKAKFGINTPLEVMNQIDYEKDKIRLIEEELARRGKSASSRHITDS